MGDEPRAGDDDMAPPSDTGHGAVDVVLQTHEVCGYALVASLTAITLAGEGRNTRLVLFSQALDAFERGAFEAAVRQARAAALASPSEVAASAVHDAEALRERLNRLLIQICGRA
ncbi:MAG: hypothetical protein KIT16_05680 [Rhodospirillaceae bacterium]|nr:hypothetical protein [Rhodospirillaceae bacterium]